MVIFEEKSSHDHGRSSGGAPPLGQSRASTHLRRPEEGPPGLQNSATHGSNGEDLDDEVKENLEQQNYDDSSEASINTKQDETKETSESMNEANNNK